MSLKKRLNQLKISFNIWKHQLLLDIGANLIRRGALLQYGQPVRLNAGDGPALKGRYKVNRSKGKTVYVKNMFFDFKNNKITYSWSDKPIVGFSERFKNKD